MASRTVTFLFTDIEGSTRLWDEAPLAMGPALARHDALMREAIAAVGGRTFKTVGDAFCAAFDSAPAAVAATLAAQFALAAEPWSTPRPIRVRMAIHTGEAEARDGDYFGPPLNRAARLLATGHGGQTLVSAATYEIVRDNLPPGASLATLGDHRLKDLARPETVYGLLHPALKGEFPPLRSLDSEALPNNLPEQTTSFVGRERELADVAEGLRKSRVLTLTGAGGSGKTRLALQAAAEAIDAFPGGAWLVELAPLAEPALVAPTLAGVLGVVEEAGRPLLATLAERLRKAPTLLVLDNCEHVLDAAARLADALVRGAPGTEVLATSREPLGIGGETVLRVPTLSLPRKEAVHTPESLSHFEAVRLFVERAVAQRADFAVTNANAPALASLCLRLDGIPLAIELAAARVRALTVEGIEARLDDRFRLLTGGSRTSLPRQQTLRALVEWSHDLLNDAERAAFRRLAVFADGWTLEAAESVVAGEDVEEWEVLDLLTSLVDKSLVLTEEADDALRYGMLETIRQYAGERLEEGPEEARRVRDRHAAWLRERYRALGRGWFKKADAKGFVRLEADLNNLRAACDHLLRTDGEAAASLILPASGIWTERGRYAEIIGLIDGLLVAWPDLSPERRTSLLNNAGESAERLGDPGFLDYFERALAERRRLGDRYRLVDALSFLGDALNRQGEPARAKAYLLEGGALDDSGGTHEDAVYCRANLGVAHALLDEADEARAILVESETELIRRGHWGFVVEIRMVLGRLALRRGDADAARPLTQALEACARSGSRVQLALGLFGAVLLAHAQGRDDAVAWLAGLHDRAHRDAGSRIAPVYREEYAACVDEARARLGSAEFEAAYAESGGVNPDDAASYALATLG